jgi:hypothetical protein
MAEPTASARNHHGRGCWIWPWRPSSSAARSVAWLATLGESLVRGKRWLVSAALVGALPLLLAYYFPFRESQVITGLLLTPLFLSCVMGDQFFRAAGIVAVTISIHSAIAITLSAQDPPGTAYILKGSEEYWQRTWHWVSTGDDPEYQWRTWVPAHLRLLVGVPLSAYSSLGVIPFGRGIQEIDYMNFYVGQLIRVSDRPTIAILCGWHPWSVIRGLAYTFLVYEMCSWSLARLTGQTLSPPSRRRYRWACGLGLVALDALVKLLFAPTIRDALFANLLPGVR